MTRIGCFTGRLYDSSFNVSDIKECCVLLNYKEPVLDDEELVVLKRSQLKQRCIGCHECEESRKQN